jgi:predicted ATP-grasp superfamily ATP-dependent carboligase
MNGVSEQMIQTLKKIALAILAGSNLINHKEFWAETVATAIYIRNKSLSQLINSQILIQCLNPTFKVLYNYLKSFSCLAYILVLTQQHSN